MNINEDFEFLKKFYFKNLGNKNRYSNCSLMSTYTGEELKKLFLTNDVISQYLEIFLLDCYQARDLLVLLSDELKYILDNSDNKNMFINMQVIIRYFSSLRNIANYCDSLQINSKAKNYFFEYKSYEELNDKALSILKDSNFRFRPSKGNEIFEKERKKIFKEKEDILENLENNLIAEVFRRYYDISVIEKTIITYYKNKRNANNFDICKQKEKINELCRYVSNYNLDSSDELLMYYDASQRKSENKQIIFEQIQNIYNSLEESCYINHKIIL